VIAPARRVRHVVRSRIAEFPALYLPFARRKYPGPSPEVIGADTELVIDGYTRSASTFAVYALQLAQDRPVRLAHHLHAPAQLIEAARRDVPALLLVREPRGAILSQLVREPGVALRDALVAYARFHERLLPYVNRFVVADFETVTSDFGSVIRELNRRFAVSFNEFVPTETATRECFEFIEQRGSLSPILLGFESGLVSADQARRELRALRQRGAAGELGDAWMPSESRGRAKDELSRAWEHPGLSRLRRRACAAYAQMLAPTHVAESSSYAGRGQQP
jgi:hypothetical protein